MDRFPYYIIATIRRAAFSRINPLKWLVFIMRHRLSF